MQTDGVSGFGFGESTVWIMPVGAEPMGRDGKQMFYATSDGLGSVTPLGTCVSVTLDLDMPVDPDRPSPLSGDMKRMFGHMLGGRVED